MNISAPLGILLGGVVIAFVALTGIKNPGVFLSPHAAFIVVGGTAAAALVCLPMSYFFNLFRVFIETMMGKRAAETVRTIDEIVKLSQAANDGRPLNAEMSTVKNMFLREALELMETGGLTDGELEEVLEKRMELQNEKYKRDSFTFKMIGKFPPAFGLVGTTMGMIGLLQSLGEPDAFERLGPSMSIALVATFYGLVFANVFLVPMGENLNQASEEDLRMRRIVVDGVRLLKERKHPLLVHEYLKSYLAPSERSKMAKAT